MNDEFYIGWEAKAAPGIGKTVRKAVAGLLVVAAVAPIMFVISQRMIGASAFEWGKEKAFAGVFELAPYPHLLVRRPGGDAALPDYSAYYMVAQWKFGLDPKLMASLDGRAVTVKGALIYRGDQTMIETKNEWVQADAKAPAPGAIPQPIALGKQTLVGEIVDSKCFLGVMNPGELIPHRACAVRCISGGIPPVLVVKPKVGPAIYLLLVSAEGKPVNQQVLDLVAEPVEITGEVQRQGELLILRADPATYRKL